MRLLISMLLLTAFGLAACHEPGPAERTGRSIDRTGERVRDTVDPPSGPGERVGRAVDRALH